MINGKKHLPLLLFFLCTLSGFWFLSGQVESESTSTGEKLTSPALVENSAKLQSRGPASVPQSTVKSEKVAAIKPIWKEKLEKLLLAQGGGQVKSATIEKVDSFKWKMGNVEVPVDSVLVKIVHVKGHRSSFRAIVDSSNGKLLQTWDRPHFDDFGNKHALQIKIDQRYHHND